MNNEVEKIVEEEKIVENKDGEEEDYKRGYEKGEKDGYREGYERGKEEGYRDRYGGIWKKRWL